MARLKLNPGIPLVVVGGAWGDEGKGKFVDILAQDADIIIRANGGANAGHSVRVGEKQFDFHLIPSGVLYPGKLNILGSGVTFNPAFFIEELRKLKDKGVKKDNILISSKANLVLPYHIYLDQMEEDIKGRSGSQVGTTKQGVGPSNTDLMRRISLRACHLTDKDLFMKDLEFALSIHRHNLNSTKTPDVFKLDYYLPLIDQWIKFFKGRVTDTEKLVREALVRKKKILVEGAQGTLLDIRHGTFPNVTTSSTTVAGLADAAGIPRDIRVESVGVFKAYFTRVGSGGMPSEIDNSLAQVIRDKAHEYGVTTGRPRRIGFFDGVAAAYSHYINNFTFIVISCADVVCNLDSGLGPLKIARSYTMDKKTLAYFPWLDEHLKRCQANYNPKDTFASPKVDFSKVKSWDDFPKELQRYIKAIESTLKGTKLLAVGVGAGRDQLVVV